MRAEPYNLANAREKQALHARIDQLKPAPYVVEIKRYRKTRSNQQNRYYWSCVVTSIITGIKEAWGETLAPEEAHDLLKRKFLGRTLVDRNTGEAKSRIVNSSAKLTTEAFAEYIEQCCKFAAASLGVVVPSPMEEVRV